MIIIATMFYSATPILLIFTIFTLLAAAYIDINGTDITVRVALTANGAMTNWNASQAGYNFTIYRLPTDHTSDPTRRCEVFASNQFLVETLAAGTSGVVNLPLSTLLMCSIVAVDSATGVMTGCGTIMGDPSTANVIARAVFYQPIGGTLYLLDYGGVCVCACACVRVCMRCMCVCGQCTHYHPLCGPLTGMDGVKIVGELYSVTGPDIQNSMVTAQLHSGQVVSACKTNMNGCSLESHMMVGLHELVYSTQLTGPCSHSYCLYLVIMSSGCDALFGF